MKAAALSLSVEISACFIIWTGSVLFSLYKLKVISEAVGVEEDVYEDFSEGLFFIGGKRDSADLEWQNVKQVMFSLAPWLVLNFVVSEYLRLTKRFQLLPYIQSTISVCYMLTNYNFAILVISLCQPIVFRVLTKFSKRIISIWLCEIMFLLMLHMYKTIEPRFYNKYIPLSYHQYYQTMVSFAWINLRCLSYHSDMIEDDTSSDSIMLLAYCLYLPLLYCGPFVQYKDFMACQRESVLALRVRVVTLLNNLIRFLFWMFMTEIFLHYVYVNVISYRPQLIDGFDLWTRGGLYYAMGQFFHLKYVVLYGISTSLSKAENIPAPNIPKCIGRIHLYSDMWKYFDAGLYTFLLRYIYVPALKLFVPLKAHGTALCFLFVFVWHGMQSNIFIWAALNYIGVTLEQLFKRLWKPGYDNYVSPAWKTRIACMLATPLLAMSISSSTYFFAGTDTGNILFQRLLYDGLKSMIILFAVLYCNCQLSTFFKNSELKKAKSK